MCGIAGILNKKIGDKEGVIGAMVASIVHRGPDEDGFFVDSHVGLGMRRLSIIDLSAGKQPITSADDNLLIFFNGEIYNYLELRKTHLSDYSFKTNSDTEVILHLYEKFGEKMLPMLRGMFTFCIYNQTEHSVFIARDFFGIKPLYYLLENNAVVAFGSEIKSLLQYPGYKPEVNDSAVYNYLSYQYNPLTETFFKNIYKLPPAHHMHIQLETGETSIQKYWSFNFDQKGNLDEEIMTKKVFDVMKDSVAHHMIADVPVGSFLSGGVDSSIIATLMQEVLSETNPGKKVKTFTVGFDTLSEGAESRETSNALQTDHREITVGADEYFKALPRAVWHLDEPVADPSAIGLYFVAQEARKHVTVVLSGEGADELFGGYNIYGAPYAYRKIAFIPKSILKLALDLPFYYFGKNYISRAYHSLDTWYIGNASIFKHREVAKLWKGAPIKPLSLDSLYQKIPHVSDSTKMQYIDIHTWLVGDILAKADKMTMAHSLELRVPFLDTAVADIARILPDSFKWKNGTTKSILRNAFSSIIPETTRNRKKLGFPTPVRDWFTTERNDVYSIILENKYIQSHFDIEYISKLIHDHTDKVADNSRKIYLFLILALWYDIFIEHKKHD